MPHNYAAASRGAHTDWEGAGPGTAASHGPGGGRENKEEDRWGCWPGVKDL